MIKVHHLEDSRSQRILWLLEELGVEYDMMEYRRHPETNRGPQALFDIHPLGKSPVITDDGKVVAETGAIIEYILDRHGDGRMRPTDGDDELAYLHWLHFAEGSLMLPLMLMLVVGRIGDAAAPAMPFIQGEAKLLFGYVEDHLSRNAWFAGESLSGADIAMSFPLEAAHARGLCGPETSKWVETIQGREAYKRALERGGHYIYGPKNT